MDASEDFEAPMRGLSLIAMIWLAGCGIGAPRGVGEDRTVPVLGYIARVDRMPRESAAERERRLRIVAERRSRGAIIIHRGDRSAAPENTLEAYAAAMDGGADGFEVDVAMSRDGVLFAFHDRTLNTTNATGHFGKRPRAVTYYELLSVTPAEAQRYGRASADTRPPTLVAVLTLARQRGALVHIDPKDSSAAAQRAIAKVITEADMWPHVVHIHEKHWYPILAGAAESELLNWTRYRPERGVDWHRAQEGWVYQDWIDPARDRYAALEQFRARGETGSREALPHGLRSWWGPDGAMRRPGR